MESTIQKLPVTYDKILLPLSRPETIESLVRIACDLMTKKGGSLLLVNVVEVPPQLPYSAVEKTDASKELLIKAANFAKSLGVNASMEMVNARMASDAIVSLASQYGSNLILLGSSQRMVHQKVLFGNVVDKVLMSAPCDVVVFSYTSEMKPIGYERILVPTSGYRHAQRALEIGIDFEMKFGGKLSSIYVGKMSDTKTSDAILDMAKQRASKFGVNHETIFRSGGVTDNIINEAKKGKYSLIIIGSNERPQYFKFLLGSTADEIVNRAPCNVLVVSTKAKADKA
jgi:nucleotide-binding universal stress UspA family protein